MALAKVYIATQSEYDANGKATPSLSFDCVTEFKPSFKADITQFAVSDKSTISNNRAKKNTTFSVVGRVSIAPLIEYENSLISSYSNSGRPQAAYDIIKGWHDNSTTLTLVWQYDVYTDVQIKDFEPVVNNTYTLEFNITFEQVRRASYQRVSLVQDMSTSKAKDAATETQGSDSKTELNTEEGRNNAMLETTVAGLKGAIN